MRVNNKERGEAFDQGPQGFEERMGDIRNLGLVIRPKRYGPRHLLLFLFR